MRYTIFPLFPKRSAGGSGNRESLLNVYMTYPLRNSFRPFSKPGAWLACRKKAERRNFIRRPLVRASASAHPGAATPRPHYPIIVSRGVHWKPIGKGFQVYNLEDGGVLMQYGCSDCPELVKKPENLVRGYSKYVILAPYPAMKHGIALTAWGRIDTLDAYDEKRITAFINAFRDIDHHPRERR